MVAGAVSMATGEYVSVHSQADSEQADLAFERTELGTNDEGEHRELAEIYIGRGLEPALPKQVAVQLMARNALEAHARDELGIRRDPESASEPGGDRVGRQLFRGRSRAPHCGRRRCGDRRYAAHLRRGRPGAHAARKGRRIVSAALPSKAHAWRQFATRWASIGCLINGRPDRLDHWSSNCGDRDDDPDLRRRCRRREVQCGRLLRTRPSGCPALNTKSQAPARRRPGRL